MDWKAAAKRRRWIVKETEEDASVAPVLFIDAWPTEDGEHFISFMASLFWAAMEADRTIEFFTPDRHFPGGATLDHYREVWRYLALVDLNSGHVDPSPLVGEGLGEGTTLRLGPSSPPSPTRGEGVLKGINAVELWKTHRDDAVA
jgi:hypothetical protein